MNNQKVLRLPALVKLIERAAGWRVCDVIAWIQNRSKAYSEEIRIFAESFKQYITDLIHLVDGGACPAIRSNAVLVTPVVLADCTVRKSFATSTGVLLDRIEVDKRESYTLAALRDVLLPNPVSVKLRANIPDQLFEEPA